MSTLLWMISFILHGISLLAIYLLVKDRQRTSGNKEAETALKETLAEIRRENRVLQNLLEEDKQSYSKTTDSKDVAHPSSLSAEEKEANAAVEEALQNPEMFPAAVYEDEVETSLEAKVLKLHANGETTDEIAKQLNCGKNEAAIIIKMHQKKS